GRSRSRRSRARDPRHHRPLRRLTARHVDCDTRRAGEEREREAARRGAVDALPAHERDQARDGVARVHAEVEEERPAQLRAVAQRGDDVEAARAAARKGSSFYDLGKYSEALDSFETAYQRKAVPALLFNIAQCHRQLGHLEQAARVYKSYLRTDPPEASARQ